LFQELLAEVKTAAGDAASKYALRALIAVPFLLAIGFATAAVTLMLIDRFGTMGAYLSVASIFFALGILAKFVSRPRTSHERNNIAAPTSSPNRALTSASALLNILLAVELGLVLALHGTNNRPMLSNEQLTGMPNRTW
jgi:hypothetical protein